jgi:hypothetical protein
MQAARDVDVLRLVFETAALQGRNKPPLSRFG